MRRYCTIPDILGIREWFERNYGSCCRMHDKNYSQGKISRSYTDKQFLRCMGLQARNMRIWRKLYHYPFIGAAYVFVRAFGWIHFNKDK